MVPSLPATVTCVALVAVTVRVDELPAATEVGLALIATVGAGDELTWLPFTHPISSKGSRRPGAIEENVQGVDGRMRAFFKLTAFLSCSVDFPMGQFEATIQMLMSST